MVCKRISAWVWLLFILCSCESPHQQIAKLWLYTHYTGGDSKTLHFSPTSFLLLSPDGTYTKEFGQFETGHWDWQPGELRLVNTSRDTARYPVSCDGQSLRLTTPQHELINFDSAPVNLANDQENPFAGVNNQWRIKAPHKENEHELKERLRNHLQYWVTYFTWAYTNNLTTVDVRSTPTPIKIYGNGLTVKPLGELPSRWIQLFFDEQDCIQVNRMLEKEVRSTTIAWSHTDNKFKMFVGAFQQLRDGLQ